MHDKKDKPCGEKGRGVKGGEAEGGREGGGEEGGGEDRPWRPVCVWVCVCAGHLIDCSLKGRESERWGNRGT